MRAVPSFASRLGLAVVAVATACGTPSTGTDASTSDATFDATIDVRPYVAPTQTFVIDQLTIDPTDSPDVPHTGFNLDGYFSTDVDPLGCTHPDYFSLSDNDQNCAMVDHEHCLSNPNPGCAMGDPGCMGGVDNQLPTLANTIMVAAGEDIRASFADAIATSRMALVVIVSGIDDATNDPGVRVSIHRAYPTFGGSCDAVLADHEYSLDRASLMPGTTDPQVGALAVLDGSIVNGRLRARAATADRVVDLPLTLRGITTTLALHGLQIRADLRDRVLENGSLGGWVPGIDLDYCATHYCPGNPVRGVIGGLVDIQVMGICDGSVMTPITYGGVGMGFGVHAIPARISATAPVADAPAPGTCGALSTIDGGRGDL